MSELTIGIDAGLPWWADYSALPEDPEDHEPDCDCGACGEQAQRWLDADQRMEERRDREG